MICEKCGTEFFEGRNCPNCNALAIFVKDDEYKNRKAEWEEENAPKEEVVPEKKKFTININIDPKIVKRVLMVMAAFLILAGIVFSIAGGVMFVVNENKTRIIYNDGTIMNSKGGNFSVYPVEDAIFTADNAYVYQNSFVMDGIVGEVVESVVSLDGSHGAAVSMEGNDNSIYYLYEINDSECNQLFSTDKRITRVKVNNDGSIIYVLADYGAYDVIINMDVMKYLDGRSVTIASGIKSFTQCENDDEFIYLDSNQDAYRYKSGSVTLLLEDAAGMDIALTTGEDFYYVDIRGNLYSRDRVQAIDTGVTMGTLKSVSGSEKIIYSKDDMLYCYGDGIKNSVVLISEYSSYGECTYVSRYGKLYVAYDGRLFVYNSKGKNTESTSGVSGVYMTYK